MKIVIAGAGEVGSHLATLLSSGTHEVTIIDEDQKLLDEAAGLSDVITVEGDPTTFAVLKKASVRKCDLFVAVWHEENVNIIAAMLAKQLGARKCIARIDNNEYLDPLNKDLFTNIGIDYLLYPEKLAAQEVVNLLGHSSTSDYMDFSDGKLALVVLKLDISSPWVGKTLVEAARIAGESDYRTVAVNRGSRTLIPRGDDEFAEGDTVFVVTRSDMADKLTEMSGKKKIDIRSLIIFGGSRLGVRIALELQDRLNVKLIEYNAEKAYQLAEVLDQTLIINEDGRNIEALIEEGIASTDAFVAVTGRAETNILAAMIARKMGVKKVIAEVENLNFINIADSIGIDTIINKKIITASSIFRFTLSTDIQSVRYLTGSDAEVLEFIVKPNSPATRNPLRSLDFPRYAIVGGVVRGENVLIPVGDTQLQPYDRVLIFALPGSIDKIGKYFN